MRATCSTSARPAASSLVKNSISTSRKPRGTTRSAFTCEFGTCSVSPVMLRSVIDRGETDSTTPSTFSESIATVSPIRNQPSKNMSRPATTSVRNRCAAKPITIARNDAPITVWSRCAPDRTTIVSRTASPKTTVADAGRDQRDRRLALADARDHAGLDVLRVAHAAALVAVDEVRGDPRRDLAQDPRDEEEPDHHDHDRERAAADRQVSFEGFDQLIQQGRSLPFRSCSRPARAVSEHAMGRSRSRALSTRRSRPGAPTRRAPGTRSRAA